jgi:anti-sigma regulatory factor (Ser/Thr protein kinase)
MLEGSAASDDVAVLTVQLTSTGVAGEDDFQRWIFDSADAVAAMAARREFAEAFAARGASIEDTCSAEIVFGELVGNTVRYAPGDVEVIADWSGAQPVLHVRDKGPGFRHISMLPPDLLSESGRGLFIVSSLTDDFRVSKNTEGGSHARAVLRRHSRALIPTDQSGLSGSLLYALTGSVSDVMSA